MPNKAANQKRIDNLTKWAINSASIPGMKQRTYIDIFEYVLRKQVPTAGYWNFPGEKWQVVMSSVVLKALHALAFELDDTWTLEGGGTGGLRSAILFVGNEVEKKAGDAKVGEDIWDGCQAALALAMFGIPDRARAMANTINGNWKIEWSYAEGEAEKNHWCGPAYLAAMVDVLRQYDQDFNSSNLADAHNFLMGLEAKDEENVPLGVFRASAERPNAQIDLWNTVLVLRTLCAASPQKSETEAIAQIRRITGWVLGELDRNVWRQKSGNDPMFLARSLHGIRAALPWIEDVKIRGRIHDWLKKGNASIEQMFNGEQEHNIKAYTAVIEYLADWTVETPAGLIFQASQILTSTSIASIEPIPREGGLRIGWLSDLHVAGEGDPEPGLGLNLLKRIASSLMQFKNTKLSSEFQQMNMKAILRRAEQLDLDHILVTGDLTNYAEPKQFASAKADFLVMQTTIAARPGARVSRQSELDPNFWTILPGNHDVTTANAGSGYERANLGTFFSTFGSTYSNAFPDRNYDAAFPLVKPALKGRAGTLGVRLIGLDSNVSYPVWDVGVNARGRLDSAQLQRLKVELARENPEDLTLVALHHHPIVITELGSKLEEYFLALKEADGRNLIKMCANYKVNAILHGHFHAFSSWSGLTPLNRQLAIVGSGAGTLTIPGTKEEFLELREADLVVQGIARHGLALFSHQRMPDGDWGEKYTNIFLPKNT